MFQRCNDKIRESTPVNWSAVLVVFSDSTVNLKIFKVCNMNKLYQTKCMGMHSYIGTSLQFLLNANRQLFKGVFFCNSGLTLKIFQFYMNTFYKVKFMALHSSFGT